MNFVVSVTSMENNITMLARVAFVYSRIVTVCSHNLITMNYVTRIVTICSHNLITLNYVREPIFQPFTVGAPCNVSENEISLHTSSISIKPQSLWINPMKCLYSSDVPIFTRV